MRKQTTVNAERYISQELKELEHTILSAQDKVVALEYQLFVELREEVCAHVAQIQPPRRRWPRWMCSPPLPWWRRPTNTVCLWWTAPLS